MEKQAAKFRRALNFKAGDRTYSERDGVLIRCRENYDQPWLYGEASPLPGVSRESAEDCWQYLTTGNGTPPPAAQFALEALGHWLEIQDGPRKSLKSNAVLDLTMGAADFQALYAQGYRVFKVKITQENFFSTVEFIEKFSREFSGTSFRLDGNNCFTAEFLSREGSALKGLPIDYFEDPCLNDVGLFESLESAGIHVALDRALSSWEAINMAIKKNIFSVAVLKPTVIGDFSTLERCAAHLRDAGKRIIITNALESEVGRAATVYLASRLAPDDVHGLSTGRFFLESYWQDQPSYEGFLRFAPNIDGWLNSLGWERIS